MTINGIYSSATGQKISNVPSPTPDYSSYLKKADPTKSTPFSQKSGTSITPTKSYEETVKLIQEKAVPYLASTPPTPTSAGGIPLPIPADAEWQVVPQTIFDSPIPKTPSVAGLPETERERFTRILREEGGIGFGATLRYGSEAVQRGYAGIERYAQSKIPGYQTYQTEATRTLVLGGSRVAPYFVPGVGAIALVGEGVEKLITPSGREKLSEQEKYYTEVKGYNPIVSKIVTYGNPIVEIALGAGPRLVKLNEVKRLKELERASPEVSIGVTEKNAFEVLSTRKTNNLQSYTFQKYTLDPKTGQVTAGKGSTIIKNLKSGEFSNPQEFTFAGKINPSEARKIKQEALYDSNIKIISEIKDVASSGRIKILTKDLKAYDIPVAGFSETKKGVTTVVYGETPVGRYYKAKPPTYELVTDIRTGEQAFYPRYEDILKAKFEPKGVGIIKDLSVEEKGFTFFRGGGKKSSPEYFKKLYSEGEKSLILKKTELPPTKVKKIIKGEIKQTTNTFEGAGENQFLMQQSLKRPLLFEESYLGPLSVEQKIIEGIKAGTKLPPLMGFSSLISAQTLLEQPRLITSEGTVSTQISKEDQISVFVTKTAEGQIQDSVLTPIIKQTSKAITIEEQIPKTIISTAERITVIPQEKQISIFKPAIKERSIFLQKQVTKQIPSVTQRVMPYQITPTRPFKAGIIGFGKSSITKKVSPLIRKPFIPRYQGFVKRNNKWKTVTSGNKVNVIKQTRTIVDNTLAASMRVKGPKGFVKLPITKQFRKSKNKKLPHTIVEKNKFRLGPLEVKEINMFKRRKR